MGPFPGNERTWKPFNPILGETFELSMENGLKFIAEQVEACALQTSPVPSILLDLKLYSDPATPAPCVSCQVKSVCAFGQHHCTSIV